MIVKLNVFLLGVYTTVVMLVQVHVKLLVVQNVQTDVKINALIHVWDRVHKILVRFHALLDVLIRVTIHVVYLV
jgi:hypothetical protein